MSSLPAGFELDPEPPASPQSSAGLPSGFVLDREPELPAPARSTVGAPEPKPEPDWTPHVIQPAMRVARNVRDFITGDLKTTDVAEEPAPVESGSTPIPDPSVFGLKPAEPQRRQRPPAGAPNALARGFVSGMLESNPEMTAETLEGFSHLAPEEFRETLQSASGQVRGVMKLRPEEYKRYAGSMFDVENWDDVLAWMGETVGQGVASSVPPMAMGTGGAIIGNRIGGKVGGIGGAIGGAAAGSFALNYGEVYKALKDEKVEPPRAAELALYGGAAMAALDAWNPATIIAKVGGLAEAKRDIARHVARRVLEEAAKGARREGLTETAQEAVKEGMVSYETGKPFVTIETGKKLIEAGVGGALTGGAMSGVAGVRPDAQRGATADPQAVADRIGGDTTVTINGQTATPADIPEGALPADSIIPAPPPEAPPPHGTLQRAVQRAAAEAPAAAPQPPEAMSADNYVLRPIEDEPASTAPVDSAQPASAPAVAEPPEVARAMDAISGLPSGEANPVPGQRDAPIEVATAEDLSAAAYVVNTEPTDAQKEAGNFAKAHVKIAGLDVSIENPKGSTRSGVSAEGTPWSVTMPADYGYLKRTAGKDGDQVDIYIGPQPQSERAYVVDQIDPKTGKFDEHKTMLGFGSEAEALATYDAAFSDGSGPQRRGSVSDVPIDEFKAWLKDGNTKKPFAKPAKAPRKPSRSGKPLSLIEFIAAQGGISPRDPLIADVRSTLGTPNKFVPGSGMLVRPTGKSLDDIRVALIEAGYLRDSGDQSGGLGRTTPSDVLELLDAEVRGQKVYSELDREEVAARQDADREKTAAAELRALKKIVKEQGLVVTDRQMEDAARQAAITGRDAFDELDTILERDAIADEQQAEQTVAEELPDGREAIPDAARAVGEEPAQARHAPEDQSAAEGEAAPLGVQPDEAERDHGEARAGTPAEPEQADDDGAAGGRADGAVEQAARPDLASLRDYARSVVGPEVRAVSLIGSVAAKGEGNDIDLLYDLGERDLPANSNEAADVIERLIEDSVPNFDTDAYDAFFKVGDRYFHLSGGAGRAIIENTDYAAEQAGRPVAVLAKANAPEPGPSDSAAVDDDVKSAFDDIFGKEDAQSQKPEAAETAEPEGFDWWRHQLTPFGREQITNVVGVPKRWAKASWQHIPPAVREKLLTARDAPQWAEVLYALPKDAQGRPDTDVAADLMYEISGKKQPSYKDLTPAQQIELMNRVRALDFTRTTKGGSQVLRPRTKSQLASSAAKNVGRGTSKAIHGLGELFGGKGKLSSGISFDDETYAKAKPLFIEAAGDFAGAWRDVGELARKLVAELQAAGYGMDVLRSMRPYLERFVQDVKTGAIDLGAARPDANIEGKEPSDGLPDTVPPGDEGASASDVQAPEQGGRTGEPGAGEGQGSQSDAPATAGERTEGQERPADTTGEAGGRGTGPGQSPAIRDGNDNGGGRARRPRKRPADSVVGENFTIEPGALEEGRSFKRKALDNIRAIELAREIEADGRMATREEQADLARYVGWGGIKGAFPDTDGNYAKGFEDIGAKLKDLLSDTEYATARRSIQYAHYTAEDVVRSMWSAAQQLGFNGGKVFEPGMGVGNFAGMMPADLAASTQYSGLELDHVTARIAKLLYPKWGVRQDDFTKAPLPKNTFDLVIGNPPFADIVIKADPAYAKHNFLLHDYFFAKSLDAVRPGGLLMFISSAGTMNKIDASAREYMADRADLVGAVRLPGNAFAKNAGTEVTTDIVVLRKRLPDEVAGDRAWTETVERKLPTADGSPKAGAVSRYFAEHPQMVLGEQGFFDKLYPGRYAVRAREGQDLKADLAKAFDSLPRNVLKEWDTSGNADIDFGTSEKKEGTFYAGLDNKLMQVRGGVGVPVERRGAGVEGGRTQNDIVRIRALIPIRDALRAVYAADLNDDADNGAKARERLNREYDAFVARFGPINKAEIQKRRPTSIQEESARAEAREEARYAGLPFNEGSFDPTEMLREGATTTDVARARKKAREDAQAAGRRFDEGDFDPDDMPDIIIDRRPNVDAFMDDPESYRLRAIEHYDDVTHTATKSAVFRENVVSRPREPQIKSVNDAVLHVLNQRGRLDIAAVADLAGKSESETIEALGDGIYRDPAANRAWVTKDAYLSGNVRKKLALAKEAAESDPELRRNVVALEAVQPTPLAPSQIHATLGMPWIPPETVRAFGYQSLGLDQMKVRYIPALAQWFVSGDTDSVAASSTWGTDRRRAPALVQDALNRQSPRIFDTSRNPDGSTTTTLNVEATQAAQDKVRAISERFAEWIWSDPERTEKLASIYNEQYNSIVVRDYDGSYLTTPGVSTTWSWRPHQTRVISRIIQSGNTYMAHAVGAGKTSAMIGAGMEMRRLGLARKPMYAVPNHMLAQFTKEFYEQYPTARIAVADERRFHTDRRKQFIANVANEDLDAVIITHSAFGMIPVSDAFADKIVQDEIAEYRELLSAIPRDQDNRVTRSRIEKQIERLEQRLSGRGNNRKDQVFTFEEMGVDFLFVDEAHEFRKLDFSTNMGSVKGISPEGSAMAWNLYVKSLYLDTVNPGRSVVLASGTPVTNTMAELFTVSRYLQRDELQERGLARFDAWAGAFGEPVAELEQDAAGGYKSVSRFARFVNVPELSTMVRQTMDVVTSKQLEQYVVRPKLKDGKRKMNLAEKSRELERYQAVLAQRMKDISERKGPPKKGDDIMLSVINDGRHAAIDMRLVYPDARQEIPSKLMLLVDNVFDIWQRTKQQKFHRPKDGAYNAEPADIGPATQMVFANLGLSGKRGFSVPDYIRAELVRRGVPRDEIAFIYDYKTHVAKQKLFNDMNEGKTRILIGSTKKMATGVNAQRRLYAIHNLDPLWFPADDEQRNGRGLRQGNMNPEIEIHDYSTKGTYDSTMWGMMSRKARFIQGFFEGDPTLRDMDDLGEASQYEQAKAITTNDPRLIRLTELKQELERANRRKSAFDQEAWAIINRRAGATSDLAYQTKRLEEVRRDIERRQDTTGDNFAGTAGGQHFTKRADFGSELLATIERVSTVDNALKRMKIAEIGGFSVYGTPRESVTDGKRFARIDYLRLEQSGGFERSIEVTPSAMGMTRSLEMVLAGFERDAVEYQAEIDRLSKFLAESESAATRKFDGNAQIKELADTVRALEADLAAPAAQPPATPKAEISSLDALMGIGQTNERPFDKPWGKPWWASDSAADRPMFQTPRRPLPVTGKGRAGDGINLRQVPIETVYNKNGDIILGTPSKQFLDKEIRLAREVEREVQRIAPGVDVRAYHTLWLGSSSRSRLGTDGVRGVYWRDKDPSRRYGLAHIIAWSLSFPDAVRTGRHEAVHYLRGSGLLRESEWATLSKAAEEQGWVEKHQVPQRWRNLDNDTMIEEAIAEEFAELDRAFGKMPESLRRIFRKIRLLLNRFAAAARRVLGKDATAADIFTAMDTGEVGQRGAYYARPSQPKFAPAEEPGADGKPQLVIPGTERDGANTQAQRKSDAPLKPKKDQKDTDGLPLFGDKQGALFQSLDASSQTDTPAFKRWFGDSKVVDKRGQPAVVYHGTSAPIEVFDPAKRGSATGAPSAEVGFFFTSRKKSARYYADAATTKMAPLPNERAHFEQMVRLYEELASFNEGPAANAYSEQAQAYRDKLNADVAPTVLPVYLSLQNPLVHDFKGKVYRDESYRALIDQARAEGHDGVILKNTYDAGEYNKFDAVMQGRFRPETIYVAFEPTQIKSATGNRGTFDPDNPNVLFQAEDITPASTAQERQQAMQGFLAKGQPIDRAMRVPFAIFGGTTPDGQWRPGKYLHETAGKIIVDAKFSPESRFAFINPILETARSGLIDRYNLKDLPGYVDRERARALDERAVMLQGAEILKTLKDHAVGPAEAKVLQAILTGEDVVDADMAKLAEPIRNAIDQLGQEAVALGLVSPESYERNRATYVHRVYRKHEADQHGLVRVVNSIMGSKRKKIIGNQLKGRGIFEDVPLQRLMKDVREFHEGARGKPAKGDRFVVLDEMPAQGALELTGDATSERPLRRVYLPADRPIPDRYAGFRNNGTFEVRGYKGNNAVIWRDFSKAERERMGEILDARYTIAKTFMLMAHDLSVGRFYSDIAMNEDWAATRAPSDKVVDAAEWSRQWQRHLKHGDIEWVRVPDAEIPNTGGKKRYGALAGMYVREAIWRDINEMDVMATPNVWRALLTQWKLNKTARSPVVHMNNVMSNVMLMDLMDVRMQDLIGGFRSYVRGDRHYQEAFEHGAFGADLISQEIRDQVLKPILEEIERSNTLQQGGRLGALGQISRFTDILWSKVKAVDQKMIDLYRLEDELFRMATYIRRRELGDDPKQAAQVAREQFIDYDIRAPWVNAARNTVLPFISYSYRAIPLVAKAVATRPWKVAKYFALAYAANALAYAMTGDDEDRERRSLPEREQGRTWIGVPRMLRIPIPWMLKDRHGNPIFLDINRWMPAGDVFDLQGDVPAWLQLGGPLMLGMELYLNRQAFTGREIVNDKIDDIWDRTSKRADHLYKSWMPSAAYIPGSWYWERVGNAIRGATDRQGRPYDIGTALASSVGIKLKPQDVEDGFAMHGLEFRRIERELQAEARRLAARQGRNMISESEFDRGMNAILRKQERLGKKAEETFR